MNEPTAVTNKNALAEGEMIVFDLPTLAEFSDSGPNVRILSDVGTSRVVLFSFRMGQRLREHHASSPLLVQVVSGTVAFEARGHAIEVAAGSLLQLERNVPHSIVAISDAIVLVTMTPSPKRHSLSAEVFDKLTPLVTRPRTPRP